MAPSVEPENLYVLAECAALAFHKALIGICELTSLEAVDTAALRISKAVSAYYSIYHLMVCCMLLDESNFLPSMPMENGCAKYGCTLAELNNPGESPADWNAQKDLEQDLATAVHHEEIKKYCETLRKSEKDKQSWPLYKQLLYQYYIAYDKSCQKCSPYLYEKICYIRDRSVYRPTHVPTDQGFAQTSALVRDEIDSLPSAAQLYQKICEIYEAMMQYAAKQGIISDNLVPKFLIRLWYSPVDASEDDFERDGYTEEEIAQISRYEGVPSYITQLMELEGKELVLKYNQNYWKPLHEAYEETRRKLRKASK